MANTKPTGELQFENSRRSYIAGKNGWVTLRDGAGQVIMHESELEHIVPEIKERPKDIK